MTQVTDVLSCQLLNEQRAAKVMGWPGWRVKTEYSKDHLPIAYLLVGKLLQHRRRCYPTSGWLFANPVTGRPYHQEEIVKTHMKTAATAAEIKGKIGWQTFRHSYRSWLQESGAPLAVQQELMRHASITTTMNT